jgi:hypothetical protein
MEPIAMLAESLADGRFCVITPTCRSVITGQGRGCWPSWPKNAIPSGINGSARIA